MTGWTEVRVWAEYHDHRTIRYAGAYGEMIVYVVLFSLLHIWKLRAGGAFWLGVGTASYFYTPLLEDFYIPFGAQDPKTELALLTYHVVYGLLLLIGWLLFVGREWVYQIEILPWIRPAPVRPWLERIRRRWG